MSIIGLDHVAFATLDVEASIQKYEALFNTKAGEVVCVPDQGVKSAVISVGDAAFELMQPLDEENAIGKYIAKKGEGIHHIALKVDDLDATEKELTEKGVRLIVGTANGNKSIFIHPKSTGGVLMELCAHEG